MRVIAHRGFADDAPENTVAAVRAASAVADAVEFDVRRCRSGEVVVIHDETVDRVTNGSGRVDEFDREALAGLDVGGSGEGVPTLSEVLDTVGPGTGIMVELKEHGLAADVMEALDGFDGRSVVTSFDPGAIDEVHALDGNQPTALVSSRLRNRPVRTATRLGCDGVHLHWRLCLVPGIVGTARTAGLTVNAWTPNRPTLVRLLALRGVDGVAVDSAGVVPAGLRDARP